MVKKTKKDVNRDDEMLETQEPNKNGAKSVLFWGSQNSGKTSLATIIAKKLATERKHENVLLVYTDENIPPLPYAVNPKEIENKKSLGNLYSPIKLTKDFIFSNITTLKNQKNLAILGFLSGEYQMLYPEMLPSLIEDFFIKTTEAFDYVLIDGTTFFNTNALTFNAFDNVDKVINVATEDIKSVAYYKSQNNYLHSIGSKSDITILNKYFEDNGMMKHDYTVNFYEEIEESLKCGDILSSIKNKKLEKEINKIIRGVF